MKLFGTLRELSRIFWREDGFEVSLDANGSTTYTANRDNQLPPGDSSNILVGEANTQTLTNKSIDADTNTISNIDNNEIKAAAAIDATKIANGTVSNTEFQFLDGVTSSIQTQIDSKVTGPGSATDNAITRFDGTTGKLVQNSLVTVSDAGAIAGATQLDVDNLRLDGNTLSSTDTNGNINLSPNGTGIVTSPNPIKTQASLQLEETGAGTDTITLQAPSSITASYTLTLPVDDGVGGQVLTTDGAGVLSWGATSGGESLTTITNADYTVLDNDGFTTFLFDTGVPNRTLTLPAAANNTSRIIKVVKIDVNAGTVTLDGNGDFIDGVSTKMLAQQYERITIQSDGDNWYILDRDYLKSGVLAIVPDATAWGTVTLGNYNYSRNGKWATITGKFVAGAVTANTAFMITPLLIDGTVLSNPASGYAIGTFWTTNGNNTSFFGDGGFGTITYNGTDTDRLILSSGATTGTVYKALLANNSDYFASGVTISFHIHYPVAAWES